MNIEFDWLTILLAVLLLATLLAFFTGVFPYPFGWLIIAGLLVWRITGRKRDPGEGDT